MFLCFFFISSFVFPTFPFAWKLCLFFYTGFSFLRKFVLLSYPYSFSFMFFCFCLILLILNFYSKNVWFFCVQIGFKVLNFEVNLFLFCNFIFNKISGFFFFLFQNIFSIFFINWFGWKISVFLFLNFFQQTFPLWYKICLIFYSFSFPFLVIRRCLEEDANGEGKWSKEMGRKYTHNIYI